MKHIGFVDYYLSEWHANNYPAWIEQASKTLGLEYRVSYAWAEMEVSPVDGMTTQQWCDKMGVQRCDTVSELCEKSDVIVVLAPSHPHTHLHYAQSVLPYAKRTYIDKTFAPNCAEAVEIFRIAKDHDTPFFSTSALRYAEELKALCGAQEYVLQGGGRSFEEYIIHLVEMAVMLLEDPVDSVCAEVREKTIRCCVKTQHSKTAQLVYGAELPYEAQASFADGKNVRSALQSDFFGKLISDMLTFFESGRQPFDPAQTLEVMRMRDALLRAKNNSGVWLKA